MKSLETVPDVDRFSISKNLICLVKGSNLEVYGFQDFELMQVYNFNERMEFVSINENYIWLNSNSGNGFYIFEQKLFSRVNYILTVDRDSMLYEISNNGISQVSLLTQERKWTIPVSSLLAKVYFDTVYVRVNTSEIAAFNCYTGEKKWSYSCNGDFDYFDSISMSQKRKATISRFIGQHSNILWIALNSGRLLGIEAATGTLKYNICNPNHAPSNFQMRKPEEYLHYGLYMNLDEARNMLFGVRGKFYFEIDLSSPESSYSIYDMSFELKKYGFDEVNVSGSGYENVWCNEKVFFGERDKIGPSIGVFDRITKTITDSESGLDSDSYLPNIQSIQFNSGRLFVLDGKRQLHIFEDFN